MATQLGVGEWTVGNWENDETKPILRFIPRIISFLGYNPDLPNPTTTAEHLKSKRRALGWSQKQAARHLGVDPAATAFESSNSPSTINRKIQKTVRNPV